jgi:hypothetical protein
MLMWTFFVVLVYGNHAQSLLAHFSYSIYYYYYYLFKLQMGFYPVAVILQ